MKPYGIANTKRIKINFWITEKLYEKMLEKIKEEGYSSISDFIRDAIRRRLEDDRRIAGANSRTA